MPVVRQFSHRPCRTLSWTRSLVGLISVQHDAPGSLDSTHSGHRATVADAHLKRWSPRTSACSSPANEAPNSLSDDTAGAVFFPLAVLHRSLRRSISLNEFIVEIRPGWGQ